MTKVLIIGFVWPEPNSSAAGTRMVQLLNFFQSLDFKITFATTAKETEAMVDLSNYGIPSVEIKLNDSSFDRFIKDLDPGIVLFDRFLTEEQFGWRVRETCPDAVRILDTEDLHFYRKARQENVRKKNLMDLPQIDTDLAKREIASIYRCDLSLIISEVEIQLLVEQYQVSENLLLYLPFMEENISREEIRGIPGFETRKNFISIGNFRHEPNWDAVLVLKHQVWPLIRKELPHVLLHVYGAYASKKVKDLHNESEGFLVKGTAPSALDVMRSHRVLLAPLRFGAGLKGKFIDAMRTGTPSVTTSVGTEGMAGDLRWPGKVAEDPQKFADAAISLYKEKENWEDFQVKGFELLEKRFSRQKFSEIFKERLHHLEAHITSHRMKNFTGSLLHHHQMASTKYLSKYIEMKNRLDKGMS